MLVISYYLRYYSFEYSLYRLLRCNNLYIEFKCCLTYVYTFHHLISKLIFILLNKKEDDFYLWLEKEYTVFSLDCGYSIPSEKLIKRIFYSASISELKCANEITTALAQNSLLFQKRITRIKGKCPIMNSTNLLFIHNNFSKIGFQTINLLIVSFATLPILNIYCTFVHFLCKIMSTKPAILRKHSHASCDISLLIAFNG